MNFGGKMVDVHAYIAPHLAAAAKEIAAHPEAGKYLIESAG